MTRPATLDEALAEIDALRRQVAELQALGVSLHKASAQGYAIGETSERAAIVAWLRAEEVHHWARMIERGAHR